MREYKCACCHETFESGWTEEDCLEEKIKIFGDMPLSDMERVCDDCHKSIMNCAIESGLHRLKG